MAPRSAKVRWVRIDGAPCRCTECGRMVRSTWRLFESATTWSLALCLKCTGKAIGEEVV